MQFFVADIKPNAIQGNGRIGTREDLCPDSPRNRTGSAAKAHFGFCGVQFQIVSSTR
jgi:hypothetical protein